MSLGDRLNALIQVCDGLAQGGDDFAYPMYLDHAALDHGFVACGRDRFSDLFQALLDEFFAPAVVRVKETGQRLRANLLDHFQGWPSSQERRDQRRSRIIKPMQDLWIIL